MEEYAGRPLSVRWAELDRLTFDRLVATALKRRHAEVHHVDGAGGDGGCDIAFPTQSGLQVFQLKFWSGRLQKAQREQVKRSLERAAEGAPAQWFCVCPVNLTPGERQWFEALVADKPFPCHWLGLDWLDGLMAEFPDVVKYFCHSTSDEVVQLLRELGADQAALAGGIPDAVNRLQTIADRLSALDPFHDFVITVGGGQSTVTTQSKYPGADTDDPKAIKVQLAFPTTDEGREALAKFQRAIDYGDPVQLDSEYVTAVDFQGIPHGVGAAKYVVQLGIGETDCDYPAMLIVLAGEDDEAEPPPETLVALPVRFERTSGGQVRRVLQGRDASRALVVRLVLDKVEGVSLTLSLEPQGAMPSATRPVRRLLMSMEPGTSLSIRFEEDQPLAPIPVGEAGAQMRRAVDDLEALDRLQELSGRYFPVPVDLTEGDFREIREAIRLLEGGAVEETWTHLVLMGYAGKVEGLLEAVSDRGDLVMTSASILELGGNRVPLGVLAQTFVGATVERPEHVRALAAAAMTPDDPVEIRMVPAGEPRKVTARVRE